MLTRNYYLILGCGVNDDSAGFRHAFCDLVKHYHPDRVGPGGTLFVQEIAQAYRVLSDAERRNNYVRGLRDAGEELAEDLAELEEGELPVPLPDTELQAEPVTLPAPVHILRRLQLAWPSLEPVSEQVLRNFVRGQPPKEHRAEPIDVQMALTAEEATEGGEAIIDVPTYFPCQLCRGSGQDAGRACPHCCEKGLIVQRESIRVMVPAMVLDEQQVEVPLRGLGVHNFYLRLHFKVGPQSFAARSLHA